MVRIPQVSDLKTAIEIFYSHIELRNKDITKLFGKVGNAKIAAMKKNVHDKMREDNVVSWDASAVNTRVAFQVWGLDIKDLEERYKKLQELNLHS